MLRNGPDPKMPGPSLQDFLDMARIFLIPSASASAVGAAIGVRRPRFAAALVPVALGIVGCAYYGLVGKIVIILPFVIIISCLAAAGTALMEWKREQKQHSVV